MEDRIFADHFYVNLETTSYDRRVSVSGDVLIDNFRKANKNITLKYLYDWMTADVLGKNDQVSSEQLEGIINGLPCKSDLEGFSYLFSEGSVIIKYNNDYYCTISIDVVEEHHWNAITFTFHKP